MSRQLEQLAEDRAEARAYRLAHALNSGLTQELESVGDELISIAITFIPGACRLVVKAEVDQERVVGFVYGENASSCVLKALSNLRHDRMLWGADKYHQKQV